MGRRQTRNRTYTEAAGRRGARGADTANARGRAKRGRSAGRGRAGAASSRAAARKTGRRAAPLLDGVDIVFDLSNEPTLAYSLSIVADGGAAPSTWTSTRLKTNTLILETATQRFELCRDGVGAGGFDTYRIARVPRADTLGVSAMRWRGLPLPRDDIETIGWGLDWSQLCWREDGLRILPHDPAKTAASQLGVGACGPLTAALAEAHEADPSTLFIDEDEDADDEDDDEDEDDDDVDRAGGPSGNGHGHAAEGRRPISAQAQTAALSRAKRACVAADACTGSAREGSASATAAAVLMDACRRLGGFQAGSSAEVAALGPRAAEYDARHLAMPVLEPDGSVFLPLVRVRVLANCLPLRGELDREAAQASADAMRRELDDALKAYRARNPDAAALLPA